MSDMIDREAVLKAITETALKWGVTGEPAILIATKDAIAALPPAQPDAEEPISDQRIEYEKFCARISAGKASQQEAVDAIRKLCRDNERLAVLLGKAKATPAQPDAVEALVKAAIPTRDRLPEKPGLKSYEQIPCLIFVDGDWEISVWNCEHLCWDDASGDDYRYDPHKPDLWLPLPYGEPLVAALAAIRAGGKP